MKRGCFISFEGIDGSGKSTQIEKLREYLVERGHEVIVTREPGGTAIGEKIREIILDPENSEMTALTEAMLYAASRAQHVAQVIRPAVERGVTVICDRFVDSSTAYQGCARGLEDAVRDINAYAVDGSMPDLTFFLKTDTSTGRSRMNGRKKDRIEREKDDFHRAVCRGYDMIVSSEPDRVMSIDASRGIDEIFEEIKERIDEEFRKRDRSDVF